MLRVRQNWRKRRLLAGRRRTKTVILAAMMLGCYCVIARSLVRRFEQTGISIDAQDPDAT